MALSRDKLTGDIERHDDAVTDFQLLYPRANFGDDSHTIVVSRIPVIVPARPTFHAQRRCQDPQRFVPRTTPESQPTDPIEICLCSIPYGGRTHRWRSL